MSSNTDYLLKVDNLSVSFDVQKGFRWPWQDSSVLQAVQGVDLHLKRGETLGIVGESGCGKSTLARAIAGLTRPRTGSISFDGKEIWSSDTAVKRGFWRMEEQSMPRSNNLRRKIQMIFQDPMSSLNPRMTVGDIISEPLRDFEPRMSGSERDKLVRQMLDKVGILPSTLNRYPHEFSGGQCQRIGIARALILQPELLICDEPVSALDVSVQAQVINLLKDLQRDMGLAILFVAHDLSVVHHISDRVIVMYLGQIMEHNRSRDLVTSPSHPYTQTLLSAVPVPKPGQKIEPLVLDGDLPSPLNPPRGCAFASRCLYAEQRCKDARPQLKAVPSGAKAACFKPL